MVVVWAGSYAAIKQLIDDGLDAPDIALGRYLVAAPGFAIALVATRGLPGLGRRDLARLVVAGLLVVTIYHLSLNAGERLTTAGTASVVVAAAPGIALAMAVAIGQERFSRRRAAGLAVSFAGVGRLPRCGGSDGLRSTYARFGHRSSVSYGSAPWSRRWARSSPEWGCTSRSTR